MNIFKEKSLIIILSFALAFVAYNAQSVYSLDEEESNLTFEEGRGISSVIEECLVQSKNKVVKEVEEDKKETTKKVEKDKKETTKKVEEKKKESVGTIFVGDSRFVGMDSICNVEYPVVAKVGKGYKWFSSTGLDKVREIKSSKNKDRWRLVINLGVNDIYNINRYIDLYEDLKDDYELILVSVNPVEYCENVSNKQIEDFNSRISSIDGIKYIDSYDYLTSRGFSTTDGLHYTSKTYKKIYSYILNNIK